MNLLAVFLIIASQNVEDCFHCFNRIQHIQYSSLAGKLKPPKGNIVCAEKTDQLDHCFMPSSGLDQRIIENLAGSFCADHESHNSKPPLDMMSSINTRDRQSEKLMFGYAAKSDVSVLSN
jgi:hypothetical protein